MSELELSLENEQSLREKVEKELARMKARLSEEVESHKEKVLSSNKKELR